MTNSSLIEKTVQITVAKLSNTDYTTCKETGEDVADFMQKIYDKLVELESNRQS